MTKPILFLLATLSACGANVDDTCTTSCTEDETTSTAPEDKAEMPFPMAQVSITRSGEGQGHVLIDGVICSDDPCIKMVPANSQVAITLEAQPALSASLGGWGFDDSAEEVRKGSCANGATCELRIMGDTEIDVIFDVAGTLQSHTALSEVSQVRASTMDSKGNTYLVGSYHQQAPPFLETTDRQNAYVIKYSPDWTPLWASRFVFDNSRDIVSSAIALGPEGEVYVAGTASTDYVINRVLLSRFDPNTGDRLWDYTANGKGQPQKLIVSPTGNVVLAGTLEEDSELFFGWSVVSSAPEAEEAFIATFTKAGGFLGAQALKAQRKVYIEGLVADPSGGTWLSAGVDFGHVLNKYDESGALETSLSVPESGELAWTPEGDFVLTGAFEGTLDWGNEITTQVEDYGYDGFVAKMSKAGDVSWAVSIAGPSSQVISHVAIADNGNIFVAGRTRAPLTIGGVALPDFGGNDVVIASYSPEGEHRWSTIVGSLGNNYARELDLQAGQVHLAMGVPEGRELFTDLGALEFDEAHLDSGGSLMYLAFRQ